MKDRRSLVVQGMLSGSLITSGVGVMILWGTFQFWMHHMVILGERLWLVALSLPLVLIGAGAAIAVHAVRSAHSRA